MNRYAAVNWSPIQKAQAQPEIKSIFILSLIPAIKLKGVTGSELTKREGEAEEEERRQE